MIDSMFDFLKSLFHASVKKLESSGKTDRGKVRNHNEDYFGILKCRNIFLVADGMGGHNAGEVASKITIETLIDFFHEHSLPKTFGRQQEIRQLLSRGFYYANEKVMDKAGEDPQYKGMGCTLVAGIVDRNILHTCHVGDARCYLATADDMIQITNDHTSLADFKKEFKDDPTFRNLPPRHVITRAIGYPFPDEPEYNYARIATGNRLLLCSDGLWSLIDDMTIHKTITEARTPEEAGNSLVEQANEAGGNDNITALVVFCE